MERRPVRPCRFTLCVDLVTAADFDRDTVGRLLTQLATAGLMGMVTLIRSVELDGVPVAAEMTEPDPRVSMLRPPPDERIFKALRELEQGLESLKNVVHPHQAVA